MGRKSKPVALAEQAADTVSDAASQLRAGASDAAAQLRSSAQDGAQHAADAASQLGEKRGRTGLVLALILVLAAAGVWWRSQQAD